MKNFSRSKELFEKAKQHLVGGVNSPVRAFKSVGGTPIFMQSGSGSKIKDADGNEFIDLVGSWGPLILGHAPPQVVKAVKSASEKGFSFGTSCEAEAQLAEMIQEAFPSIELMRFVSSGTEAVMSAIRLARAFTGRNKIVKFAGCYHGHSDSLLVKAGSGIATLGIPGSAGVPPDLVKDTIIIPFNDVKNLQEVFELNHRQIGCVIIEPVIGNMGVILPQNNFLDELRKITAANNSLLIFDEVMTGFRACYGGAQKIYNIHPDLTTLGKVIGGGFPAAAYGGKKEIMEMISPMGNVYQAGTLSGNPVAMASGIATLTELKRQNPYSQFENISKLLCNLFLQKMNEKRIPAQANYFGSMLTFFFTGEKIVDSRLAETCDTKQFAKFFWNMIEEGVYLPPAQFEACFLNSALNDEDVEMIKSAIINSVNKL
jgi:glutamate-1-semialdehyde 2,1-aminomutase